MTHLCRIPSVTQQISERTVTKVKKRKNRQIKTSSVVLRVF